MPHTGLDRLHRRLDRAETRIKYTMHNNAPCFPVYDPTALPQDAINGQIAVGSDNSFNWFTDVAGWSSVPGQDTGKTPADFPQDSYDGQCAVGSDGSFYWYVNGQWWTNPWLDSTVGDIPDDGLLPGQIVVGGDGSFHWGSGGNPPHTFGTV